jgi:hypothetical protein
MLRPKYVASLSLFTLLMSRAVLSASRIAHQAAASPLSRVSAPANLSRAGNGGRLTFGDPAPALSAQNELSRAQRVRLFDCHSSLTLE